MGRGRKTIEGQPNWTQKLIIVVFACLTSVAWCRLDPTSDEEPANDPSSFGQFATAPVSDESVIPEKHKKKRLIVKHHGRKNKVHQDAVMVSGNVIMELDSSDDDPENGVSIVEFDTETEAHMFKGLGYSHDDIEEDPIRTLQRLSPTKHHSLQHPQSFGLDNLNLSHETRRHLLKASQIVPYGLRRIFQDQIPDPSYFPSTIEHPLCILDTGFDNTHPDLSNVSITSGDGKSTDDCEGDWHGTHVAGTVVAEDNDLGIVGVFPGAPVMIVKVFGGSNCGWKYAKDVYASTLVEAARNCVNRGAKILSMSLGGSSGSSYEEDQFRKIAKDLGVISVAAAGNNNNSGFIYPASYSACISVAATDENNQKAGFSNFNSEVDVSAPGVGVISTVGEESIFAITVGSTATYPILYMQYSIDVPDSAPLVGEACLCSTRECPDDCESKICLIPRGDVSFKNKGLFCEGQGGIGAVIYNYKGAGFIRGTLSDNSVGIPVFETSGVLGFDMILENLSGEWRIDGGSGLKYDFFSGTSMATPHVSGAIYLLWNKYPHCSNMEIRDAIEKTALNLGNDDGRDNFYGHGLIQYWAAASYLDELRCSPQEGDSDSSNTPSSSPSRMPSYYPSHSSPSETLEPTFMETSVKPQIVPVYLAMIEYSVIDKLVILELWISESIENVSVSVTVYKKNRIVDTLQLNTDQEGQISIALDKAKKNDSWLVQITNINLPKSSDSIEYVYKPDLNMIDPGYTVPGGGGKRKDR